MGAFQCISNRMKDHLAFSTYSKTTPKLKNKSSKINLQKNSIIYIRKHLANYCQKLNELLKGFFGKNPLKRCKTAKHVLDTYSIDCYTLLFFFIYTSSTHFWALRPSTMATVRREVGWVPIAASLVCCSLSL